LPDARHSGQLRRQRRHFAFPSRCRHDYAGVMRERSDTLCADVYYAYARFADAPFYAAAPTMIALLMRRREICAAAALFVTKECSGAALPAQHTQRRSRRRDMRAFICRLQRLPSGSHACSAKAKLIDEIMMSATSRNVPQEKRRYYSRR